MWKHGSPGGGAMPPLGICHRAVPWAWMWCVAHSTALWPALTGVLIWAELLLLDGSLPSSAWLSLCCPSSIPCYLLTRSRSLRNPLATAPQNTLPVRPVVPPPHPPLTPRRPACCAPAAELRCSLRAFHEVFPLCFQPSAAPGPLWVKSVFMGDCFDRVILLDTQGPAMASQLPRGQRLRHFPQPPSVLSRLTPTPRQLLALPEVLEPGPDNSISGFWALTGHAGWIGSPGNQAGPTPLHPGAPGPWLC